LRITRIRAYQVDLPLSEGSYNWSGGKSVSLFDSTVVAVETDAGVTGYGESCPLGPVYLPSFAAGVRAGLQELAPHLIGADPTQLGPLNLLMDSRLKGQISTPEEFRFTSTDFNSYGTRTIADGAPQRIDGKMRASTAAGLGITPRMEVLGHPVLSVGP
jgi:hypothetical protein